MFHIFEILSVFGTFEFNMRSFWHQNHSKNRSKNKLRKNRAKKSNKEHKREVAFRDLAEARATKVISPLQTSPLLRACAPIKTSKHAESMLSGIRRPVLRQGPAACKNCF